MTIRGLSNYPDGFNGLPEDKPVICPNCGHTTEWDNFLEEGDRCPVDKDHPVCPNCEYCLECDESIEELWEVYYDGDNDLDDEEE